MTSTFVVTGPPHGGQDPPQTEGKKGRPLAAGSGAFADPALLTTTAQRPETSKLWRASSENKGERHSMEPILNSNQSRSSPDQTPSPQDPA